MEPSKSRFAWDVNPQRHQISQVSLWALHAQGTQDYDLPQGVLNGAGCEPKKTPNLGCLLESWWVLRKGLKITTFPKDSSMEPDVNQKRLPI